MIDTHAHIYGEDFANDLDLVVERAKTQGVEHIILPAIDLESHEAMMQVCASYPDFFLPLIGVHPTSITADSIQHELDAVERYFASHKFYGIGEIGLDLYWSQEFLHSQIEALEFQIELALKHDLPISFHVRDAWTPMLEVLQKYKSRGLRGVMHAFSADYETYKKCKEMGDFLFGIGGVVTFKKGAIAGVVPAMELTDLVLETDAPYLTPTPFRGKRNESSYLVYIADKIAELQGVSSEEVRAQTSCNARRMFL